MSSMLLTFRTPFRWLLAVLLTGATLMGMATVSAYATVYREYLFDTDGVLPSADPDTEYNSGHQGPPIPETEAYSVSEGVLHQTTMGREGYAFYDSALPSAGFDASRELTIEARLRVIAITAHRNTGFWVRDGATYHGMSLFDSGAVLYQESGEVEFYFDVDVGGDFHTYRLESQANDPEYRVYQDDVLVGSVSSGPPVSENRWSFGDGSWGTENDAEVDWDYIRFLEELPSSVPGEIAVAPMMIQKTSPNPFRNVTEIRFTVPGNERVTIDAYDITGSLVARVYDAVGGRKGVWDGRNAEGRRVAPGVYFYRIRVGDRVHTEKVFVLSK